MIVHACEQGTREWSQLRMGRPTASAFDRIVSPTGKISTQQQGYLQELLAELVLGRPLVGPSMPWMDRGKDLEAEAVAFYELQQDADTVPVGFITTDDGRIGASPDRLVGDRGLLETKCPSPQVHIGYLLYKTVDKAYYPQIQGQLYVAEREWVDIAAYHPEMPPSIIRVERDEKFIALLAEQLMLFVDRLADATRELLERGIIKPHEEQADPLNITDEDLVRIMGAHAEVEDPQPVTPRERTGAMVNAHGIEVDDSDVGFTPF